MKTTLNVCLVLVFTQLLTACSDKITHPEKHQRTQVSESHSVLIEGGVLKQFSDGQEIILFVYVRPRSRDRWVVAGGGGGGQPNPWQHKVANYWAETDASGWYPKDAPRKGIDYLFDSKAMTLTLDSATYAVRRGELIVIPLNENWQPLAVKSGLSALDLFAVEDAERKRLRTALRKYYRGS